MPQLEEQRNLQSLTALRQSRTSAASNPVAVLLIDHQNA